MRPSRTSTSEAAPSVAFSLSNTRALRIRVRAACSGCARRCCSATSASPSACFCCGLQRGGVGLPSRPRSAAGTREDEGEQPRLRRRWWPRRSAASGRRRSAPAAAPCAVSSPLRRLRLRPTCACVSVPLGISGSLPSLRWASARQRHRDSRPACRPAASTARCPATGCSPLSEVDFHAALSPSRAKVSSTGAPKVERARDLVAAEGAVGGRACTPPSARARGRCP